MSEITLHTESVVRAGCEQRDLLGRPGPEIDRARHLYDERVPAGIAARNLYFHQGAGADARGRGSGAARRIGVNS